MSHTTQPESNFPPKMSHYQVLDVAPDATLEEIRRSYQSLALRLHPDKVKTNPTAHGQSEQLTTTDQFIRIDEAWKVLRDEEARRVYDAELMQRTCREEYFVNEVLRRTDFRHDPDEDFYYHTCRCGGLYVLPEHMDGDESCYISCDECSLVVQVDQN